MRVGVGGGGEGEGSGNQISLYVTLQVSCEVSLRIFVLEPLY